MNPNNKAFIISDQSISFVFSGKPYTVPRDHVSASDIIEALKEGDLEAAAKHADVKTSIVAKSFGKLKIEGERITYEGSPIHNTVVDRIFMFLDEDLPIDNLMKLLERMMKNPSRHSVEQLYGFMEHHHLPVTDNGTFLAYKAITNDWKDKRTRQIDNSIGAVVEMPRREVDDDFSRDCSYGLHAGSVEYVRGFAGSDDRVVIVEIDPADVVSVPQYDTTKLRCCKYTVIGEMDNQIVHPLPSTTASTVDYSGSLEDEEDEKYFCPYCGCGDCDEECQEDDDDYNY